MNLQPPAVLVQGAPGAGKTDSLTTYIEAGLELFVIITEPDGVVSLLDAVERRGLPIDKLHYCTVPPAAGEWSAIEDMVSKIGSMGYEDLQKIKSGIGKEKTRTAAMKFLNALKNFHCERTGKDFGDTSKWNDDRAFAVDSFSGLSMISWLLTLGYKPAAHQGEWGVAMNFLEQLLLKMQGDRSCHYALISHFERELDEIAGVNKLMVSTLGKKLAPKVPKYFSEFIMAERLFVSKDGKIDALFKWSTVHANADLKNRVLPISGDLPQSFVPIVEGHRRRLRIAGATSQPAPQPTPDKLSAVVLPAAPLTAKPPSQPATATK